MENKITIEKNDTTDEIIRTSGYILIYMKGESFKFTGTIGLESLAPFLLQAIANKMGK